jgi:hypothetical protein
VGEKVQIIRGTQSTTAGFEDAGRNMAGQDMWADLKVGNGPQLTVNKETGMSVLKQNE